MFINRQARDFVSVKVPQSMTIIQTQVKCFSYYSWGKIEKKTCICKFSELFMRYYFLLNVSAKANFVPKNTHFVLKFCYFHSTSIEACESL